MKNLMIALLLASPLQAYDFDLPSVRAGNFRAASAAFPLPVPKAGFSPAKEWTIIALINGKNSLSGAALADINEMETVGSNADINIVAEVGTAQEQDGEYAGFSVVRYLVQKDNDLSKIGSKPLMKLGRTDMGSWEHLAAFISWAKANYPAKRYMVVVWNHGSGWKSIGKPVSGDAAVEKGISYDEETGNHITAVEMARALARAGKADLFASDACLMQELAVNYEIRSYVDVIAGSEDTEPNEGQDYSAFLPLLAAKPSATAEEAAKMYVDAYASFYRPRNMNTTISAVRAASFDGLASRVTALADALLASGNMQFVKDSRRKTVKYTDPDSRDLGHFAKVVAEDAKDPSVRLAARTLYDYLKSEVVVASVFTLRANQQPPQYEPASAKDFSNSTGLAAYIPVVYMPEDNYDQLSFARNSSWGELVRKMSSTQDDADYWDDYPEK